VEMLVAMAVLAVAVAVLVEPEQVVVVLAWISQTSLETLLEQTVSAVVVVLATEAMAWEMVQTTLAAVEKLEVTLDSAVRCMLGSGYERRTTTSLCTN
jgi:hypothetical protein